MLAPNFDPFPLLETPRLRLRQPTQEDAADIFEMRSDPAVMQYIPRPMAQSVADVEPLIAMVNDFAAKGERINWAMEWKETGKVIGMIGFVNIKPEHCRAEAGYSLSRAWHRKGIMLEALRAVLSYGFEAMQLHSTEAIIDAENIPSGKLLEKAGFRQEAFFREDFLWDGVFRNSVHYGMLRGEWVTNSRSWY